MTWSNASELADRGERARELCRRLSFEIENIAPDGIGRWPRSWEIVSEADAGFVIALSAWEADPSEAGKERVRVAYHAVLEAWRRAVAEYCAEEAGAEDSV